MVTTKTELEYENTQCIHKQLHAFEDEIIQINGLIHALQQILPDGTHTCVADALEERLERLQKYFYEHWETLTNK